MRPRAAWTAGVLACLLLGPAPAEAGPADGSLIIGMRLEPPGLDPTTGGAAAIGQITLYNVYETLTRLDNNGNVLPLLAKSWTLADDGLSYTFDLVRGVTFHDGTAFDSSDVKFTFERNRAAAGRNRRMAQFANMAAIETPAPDRVVIRLKQPSSLLLFDLARASAAIVAPETAAGNQTRPVGTGPYRFERWYKGAAVVLKKYAAYRAADRVAIQTVAFRFINDAAAQVTALKTGDIDYMPGLSAPEVVGQFRADARFQVLTGTTEGETILAMNHRMPALRDLRVRRAISYAIDRQAVIDGALFGFGVPIGSHFAPHDAAYVDLTGRYPFDPARARALLAKAGYGAGLELSLTLPPPSYARRGGAIVARMLGDVGIRVRIRRVEWAKWLDSVYGRKQFDLTIIAHVEPMDIGIYANPDTYFGYDSAEFRALYDRANRALTVAEQTRYLKLAQIKLADDAANGFLFELAKVGVARRGLTGLWTNWPAFINDVAAMSWKE